jgi:hypothetical protein
MCWSGIDEEDADDLDAVMGRLARQRPPPEVARAAVKEYRRLRQTGVGGGGQGEECVPLVECFVVADIADLLTSVAPAA